MRRLLSALAALFVSIASTAAAQTLERGYDDRTMRGPRTAKGAVIYSPGLVREGAPITATPYVVDDLQAAGWDVFRFVLPSGADVIDTEVAALTDAVRDLRERSYKRLVLVGQSFGGWLSLAAAGAPGEPLDAVVALAPAAFGTRGESPDWTANATALYPLAERVRAQRVLVFLFRGDEYDPGGRATSLRETFAKRGLAAAVVVEPQDLAGHSAGLTRAFARRFGPCIRDYIDQAPPPPPFVCAHPGPAAMADFGVPADLQTVVPGDDAEPGLAAMAGHWYGAYDSGREVLFIVRKLDRDRADAVYAFGPIIRGVDAPSKLAGAGYTQRHGTFDRATGTLRFAEPEAETTIECHLQPDGRLAFEMVGRPPGPPLRAVLHRIE